MTAEWASGGVLSIFRSKGPGRGEAPTEETRGCRRTCKRRESSQEVVVSGASDCGDSDKTKV